MYSFFRSSLSWDDRNKPKYVFVNSRFKDIICSLDREHVVVMGGITDVLFCIRNNIKFVWIGYLVKAFDIYHYYGRDKSYIKALLLLERITCSNNRRHVFLWEDTLKVGASLACLFNKNKFIDTVCIQHGLLSFGSDLKPDGAVSNFNFFINSSQNKFFSNSSEKNSCVIGLPYDILIKPPLEKNIYLVGIGSSTSLIGNSMYLYSLWVYTKIQKEFIKSGCKVYYRPHPTEDMSIYKSFFLNIETAPKKNIFSASLSTYIGFNSTLLYEAGFFGNITIGINPSEASQYISDFDTSLTIDEKDINQIVKKLNQYIAKKNKPSLQKETINKRFLRCVNAVDL